MWNTATLMPVCLCSGALFMFPGFSLNETQTNAVPGLLTDILTPGIKDKKVVITEVRN